MADEQQEYEPLGLKGAEDRLKDAKEARSKYESNWFLNLAFFQGEQWVAHDGRGLYRPRARKGAIRLTDNRIRPIIRTEVARLTKARPGWAATPRAMDDQAVNSAAMAIRLLDWGYDHLNFAERRREVTEWARICSAGFIKTTWDPTVGEGVDVLVKEVNEEPVMVDGRVVKADDHPELLEIDGVTRKAIGTGEVSLVVRSPFDIYPDPLAKSMDDLRWLIDESVRSPEYIQEHYEVTVKADAPADAGIVESGFHSAGVDAAGGKHVGVRVFELWEPPSAAVPQGRRVVWCEGTLLYEGPNEYGCLPYTMFPGMPVPGRFWPDAVATDLRPIQARWNKMLSQVAENLSKFGNPAALVDKLSGVEYHGTPGELVKHNAGSQGRPPIEYLNPPSMPGYTFNFMQQMEAALREISGQYEVAQGSVPAGVTAASAISLLQEQDATRLGPDVEALENAIGKVGQQTIKLMARYYTTERIVVVVGEEGIVDMEGFRADASFQVPDITVQPMSTFPRSLAAKQAAIRDMLNLMLQYGIPVEAGAMAKVLKDMQVGGLENLVASSTVDVSQAQREHVDFLRGVEPKVSIVDNDATHVTSHEDFAKTARFRSLPPDQQQIMFEHIQLHKVAQQTKAPMVDPAAPAGTMVPGGSAVPTHPSGNPAPMTETPAPPTF